jgi:hypothetical protein
MKKLLLTKIILRDNLSVSEVYQESSKDFFYDKSTDANSCYITIYVIITDGNNIVTYFNENDRIQAGFSTEVRKPSGIRSTHDDAIRQAIQQLLDNTFEITINDEVYSSERVLVNNSEKAFYSIDKLHLIIPYFVVLPSQGTSKLLTTKFKINSTSINDAITQPEIFNATNFVSKTLLSLIASGHLLVPNL